MKLKIIGTVVGVFVACVVVGIVSACVLNAELINEMVNTSRRLEAKQADIDTKLSRLARALRAQADANLALANAFEAADGEDVTIAGGAYEGSK